MCWTKARHAVKRDVTKGEVLWLRDPSAVILELESVRATFHCVCTSVRKLGHAGLPEQRTTQLGMT